jgi:hypothetical protein
VKHFCNARNAIPHNGISDIKTVQEIGMKKHKMVADLLAVANVCIETFEAQAQLLESHGNGPLKRRQDDWEVNTTDRGDHGDCGYRGKQSLDQKEEAFPAP